uniref:Uncharacterized protein n=1 Tax=Aureoumbra lagunensis TaxID=44058 RepID=A0A7S3NN10_9STRA
MAVLLESNFIRFQLSAGNPCKLAIKGLPANATIRIDEPAIDGFMHLAVWDESGVPCDDSIWLRARVSLNTVDKTRGDLIDAPTEALLQDISSSPGSVAALPGGWRIRRTFNADDADKNDYSTTIRVSLTIDEIVLRQDVDLSLSPGRVAEIRAEQPSFNAVLGEPLSKPITWSLHDMCGNAAGQDDDGKTFHLDLCSMEDKVSAVSKIIIGEPAIDGKKKQKKRKKKRKRQNEATDTQQSGLPPLSESSQPQYEETSLDVVEVDGGRLEFNDIAFIWADDEPMREATQIRLRPTLSTSAHDESIFYANGDRRIDIITVIVEPSSRPVRLEIYKAPASRTEDVEAEDDDWGDQPITSIQVPSGKSIAECIMMRAWDIAGRRVRGKDFVHKTRYKVPNSSQVLPMDTLNESANKQWFSQAYETPARLAFRTGEARAELEILRVPGSPISIEVKEVSKNDLEVNSSASYGEDTVHLCISAFDADPTAPLVTNCHVHIRATIEDLFGEKAERTLTHAESVGIVLLQPDDSFGDRLDSVEGTVIALAEDAVINLRGVDLSNGTIPLDQSCVRVEVHVELLDATESLKVLDSTSIQLYMTLTNEAGIRTRDSRRAEKAEAKRRLDECTRELKGKEQRLTRLKADVNKFDKALTKRRNDLLSRIQARNDMLNISLEKNQAENRLEKLRAGTNAAPQVAPRAARYPHQSKVQATCAALRRELGEGYVGLVTELLFCADESSAAAIAGIIGTNRLYVLNHDAVTKARSLIFNQQGSIIDYCTVEVTNLAQVAKPKSPRTLADLRGPDRYAQRAIDLVTCSRPDLFDLISQDILKDALVFETQTELDTAERARDVGTCPSVSARVSKENPRNVYRGQGRVRLGGYDPSKPSNFVLAAPPTEKASNDDEEIKVAESQVVHLKQRYDSLNAIVIEGNSDEEDLDEDAVDTYLAQDIAALTEKQFHVKEQLSEVNRLKTSLQMLECTLEEASSEKRPFNELDPNASAQDLDEDVSFPKKMKKDSLPSRKRKSSSPTLEESNSY